MDYELPEELANYLPKQRQGFKPIEQRRPAPKPNGSNPRQGQTRPAPNRSQTKPPPKRDQTRPPPNRSQTKPPPNRSQPKPNASPVRSNAHPEVQRKAPSKVAVQKDPQKRSPTNAKPHIPASHPSKKSTKTTQVETIKKSDGSIQKVRAVYPNKSGKMLSQVPDSKWKEVRKGPREDPSVVRTKEEEIQIFLKYTNDYRAKNGLNSLELSDELSRIAEGHNVDMMKGKTKVGHEGFQDRVNKLSRRFFQASENCAMYVGPREHLLTLFENLCRSLVHNKNLLGNFDTIGLAIGKNAENMWYVTQFFVRFNKS